MRLHNWPAPGLPLRSRMAMGVLGATWRPLTHLLPPGRLGVRISRGLIASGLFLGMNTATIFPIGQILGGPHAAGKWMGVQNCLANTAGILAPILTGYVVDATGRFGLAFAVAAVMSLIGIFGWGVIIRRVETLDWA